MTPPHFEPVPNRTWIYIGICRGLSVFNNLRREFVVRCVSIGGNVDNHCLNLFSDLKVLSMHGFYRLCKITWEV